MVPSCKDFAALRPHEFPQWRKQVYGRTSDLNCRFLWLKTALQDPKLRDYYRIYGADLDKDVLQVARDISSKDFQQYRFAPEAIDYYLRQMWRRLMSDYALAHALRVEIILCCGRRDWAWVPWRVVSGYCLPRLGAALAIGWISVNNFGDLLKTATQVSQTEPNATAWTVAALLSASFLVGALDVQRRIGRRFTAIIRRSCALLMIGVIWTGVAMAVHARLCSYLKTPYCLQPRLIAAALSLFLAHVMQLFWHEYSTAEPL